MDNTTDLYDTEAIMALIPHRHPFLFVDRILEEQENSIITEKVVRADEGFFQGHYPGNPIMPGVLLSESVFQTAAIYLAKKEILAEENKSKIPVLARILDAKFKTIVRPGDVLKIEAQFLEKMGIFFRMSGNIKNQYNKIVLTLECLLALVDKDRAGP